MKITDIRFERGAVEWNQLPSDGLPEVAFVGRSNVGKSSLINMLARRRHIARTSRTPGKTRELNCYRVNGRMVFVDLPGYGYARVLRSRRNRWRSMILRYLSERSELRLVLHLLDSRHPPTERDLDMASTLGYTDIPRVVVLTKTDKLSGNGRMQSLARVEHLVRGSAVVLTSATTGCGREELLALIGDLAV